MVIRRADQFAGSVSRDRSMKPGHLPVPRFDGLGVLRHGVQRPLAPLRQDEAIAELDGVGVVTRRLALVSGLAEKLFQITRPSLLKRHGIALARSGLPIGDRASEAQSGFAGVFYADLGIGAERLEDHLADAVFHPLSAI